MKQATAGVQAVQSEPKARAPRKSNKNSKVDTSDRDLASAGGAADQGRNKQPAADKVHSSSSNLSGRSRSSSVDTPPLSVDPNDISSGAAAAAAVSANKHENPQRWSKLLGSVGVAPPSATSMAPGRKQPQQQTAGQDKVRSSKAVQAAPAGGGKGGASGSTTAPAANGSGKAAGHQGSQQQAKPVRVTRTMSNSSNEATTPVQHSQTGTFAPAASKQQPQPPAASGNGSAAPKPSLSYAAAAVHRQPAAAPAPATAAARAKKPAPPPAAPQEPFPPLSSPNKPQPAAGTWGSTAGTPAKTWGVSKQPEQPAYGKAEASSSQPQKGPSADPGGAAPAPQGKPAPAANGPSKADSQVPRQASNSSSAGGSSALPAVLTVPRPERQDSFGGRGGVRGRGGGRVSSGGSSSNQWAPKQSQLAAQMQQPVDSWTSEAAAYGDALAKKSSTPNAAAGQQPAQEAPVQHEGSSAAPQAAAPASQQAPSKLADKPSSPKSAQQAASSKASALTPAASGPAQAALQGPRPAAPKVEQQQPEESAAPAAHGSTASAAKAPAAPKQQDVAVPATTPAGYGATHQQAQAGSTFGSASAGSAFRGDSPAPPAAAPTASGAPPAAAAASSSLPPKTEVAHTSKQPAKQPLQQQQQHSPVFKLPSSQAVNMAAVAARSHGSEDSRLGAHSYGNIDAFGGAYQAMGVAAYQASSMQAGAMNSFIPLGYPGQMPTNMGPVNFLLGPTGGSSAFREGPFADASSGPQQYGGMVGSSIGSSSLSTMAGPQPPPMPSSALHAAAGGPSSTGSRSGGSTGVRGGNSSSSASMKRHLSADAPPFEVPARTSGNAAGGSGSTGADGGSGNPSQRSGGSRAGSVSRGMAGSRSSSPFSRQLFELAEQVQADEQARDAERAEAARHSRDLQDKLAAEKAARAAAEARAAALEQDLAASHQQNKGLEQELGMLSSRVSELQADAASKAAEADEASTRAAGLKGELHSVRQQLDDAQAHNASLQQQCHILEAERLQLQHSLSVQGADAARKVADAAVAAATAASAAAIPAAGIQGSNGMHASGLGGAHGHGGLAARLPPPGFDAVPHHQYPGPDTPGAGSGPLAAPAAAGPAQADLMGDGMPVEMNEHQLVLAFLSLLPAEAHQALRFSEQTETEVNVKLMPLTWDEHYQYKYGPMQKFMTDRPMVFGWRDDGAFYKYHNSEELVRHKMAQDAAAAAAPVQPAPAPADSSSKGGSFLPANVQQQQPQGPPSGGWHSQFPVHQQHVSAPMLGQGQHSMHSGPPTGQGMAMHMGAHPAGPGGPVPTHMGSMGVSVGMPYHHYPMHNAPASMALAGPSVPFQSGQQGW